MIGMPGQNEGVSNSEYSIHIRHIMYIKTIYNTHGNKNETEYKFLGETLGNVYKF